MINTVSKDYQTIKEYINTYTSLIKNETYNIAPPEKLFAVWAEQKKDLYALLGNNLLIEKTFNIDNQNDLKEAMRWDLIYQSSFYNSLPTKYRILFKTSDLYNNSFSRQEPLTLPGGDITIMPGEKITKALAKIAAKEQCQDKFEEWRLRHSQILNSKQENITVTLSIHPMDFMTASDNNANWNSCLSWLHTGSYRAGTIELMNSPIVISAHINTAHNPLIFPTTSWPSKRWRQFFIVSREIILPITAYPYANYELTALILDYLKELAENTFKVKYTDKPKEVENGYYKNLFICLNTHHMYNDIEAEGDNYIAYINKENLTGEITKNYSGTLTCILCGNPINTVSSTRLFHGKCCINH